MMPSAGGVGLAGTQRGVARFKSPGLNYPSVSRSRKVGGTVVGPAERAAFTGCARTRFGGVSGKAPDAHPAPMVLEVARCGLRGPPRKSCRGTRVLGVGGWTSRTTLRFGFRVP